MDFHKVLCALTALTALSILLAIPACQKTELVEADDPLLDPVVEPKVVFTYPSDNTTGPFNLYSPRIHECSPNRDNDCPRPGHFFVQFNKLMVAGTVGAHTVHITGFDNSATLRIRNPLGERLASTFEFVIQHEEFGYYSDDAAVFELGKTYTVSIDTGVWDATGRSTQTPFFFSFTPEPDFRILDISPSHGESVSTDATPQILFNSMVDSSVLTGITFSPPVPGRWYFTLRGGVSLLEFEKTGQLREGTGYKLSVAENIHDKAGHRLSTAMHEVSFSTYAFRVIAVFPPDGSVLNSLTSSVAIMCSAPVNSATLASALISTPVIQAPSVGGNFINLGTGDHDFRPSTRYEIVLNTNLKSTSGSTLTEPLSFSFTTPAFTHAYGYFNPDYPYVSRSAPIPFGFTGRIDTLSVPSAFSIDPPVKGTFRYDSYYGSNGFEFVPDTFLTYRKTYRTIISTALRSIDGYQLNRADTLDILVTQ